MNIDLSALPDDPAALQQMLRAVVAAAEQQQASLQGAVQEPDAEIDKLRLLIQHLMCHQFGRRSKQLNPELPNLLAMPIELTMPLKHNV